MGAGARRIFFNNVIAYPTADAEWPLRQFHRRGIGALSAPRVQSAGELKASYWSKCQQSQKRIEYLAKH
jgi:hypothetical protein